MTEADPVSETLHLVVFRVPDDGQSPETLATRIVERVVFYAVRILSKESGLLLTSSNNVCYIMLRLPVLTINPRHYSHLQYRGP
jgi:hypothetical protein